MHIIVSLRNRMDSKFCEFLFGGWDRTNPMSIRYVIISISATLTNQFEAASSIIRNINSHMNLVLSTNWKYWFCYQMLTAGIGVERPQFTWAFTKWVGSRIRSWSGQLVYCGMRTFGEGRGRYLCYSISSSPHTMEWAQGCDSWHSDPD